jgi:hypothetical protein
MGSGVTRHDLLRLGGTIYCPGATTRHSRDSVRPSPSVGPTPRRGIGFMTSLFEFWRNHPWLTLLAAALALCIVALVDRFFRK